MAAAAAILALLPGAAVALETAEIKEMETLLRSLGFDPGPVDGVVDADTIEAIRRYQEFAVLPGEPEPSLSLLNELRGVAAAFAALSATEKEQPPTAKTGNRAEEAEVEEPEAEAPVAEAPEAEQPEPEESEAEQPEAEMPEPAVEKVIVPPPPPPPKLKPAQPPAPASSEPRQAGGDTGEAAEAPPGQLAELPPATGPMPPPAPDQAAQPSVPSDVPVPTERPDPAAQAQARIDAEIAPFRILLNNGSLSREELARRFNQEGRQALDGARYAEAIRKFSVAIHLDPNFAGAYSNRGTAYQHLEESALAAQDFAKARQMGFGGFRLPNSDNPFR